MTAKNRIDLQTEYGLQEPRNYPPQLWTLVLPAAWRTSPTSYAKIIGSC